MASISSHRPPQDLLDALDEGDVPRFRELLANAFEEDEVISNHAGDKIAFGGLWIADTDFGSITKLDDWLHRARIDDAMDFGVNEKDYTEEFWARPVPLYHCTPEANVASIVEHGLLCRATTRGISNRGTAAAIFATDDPDEVAESSYGPATITIDTAMMRAEGHTIRVSREPDVEESEWRRDLAFALGAKEFEPSIEHGMSERTVILHGNVPARFLAVGMETRRRPALPTPDLPLHVSLNR